MICSKCGQELNQGAKFCTKCGTKFNSGLTNNNNILSYLSFLSVVGVIGLLVVGQLYIKNPTQNIVKFIWIFRVIIFIGILLSIISLYKQKSKLAFLAGIIPCGYYILAALQGIFPSLGFLYRILRF